MRHDIQCLRAIAIIGVVGFHIFPDNLPNGFLGVDVFFVISAFLMSKILYAKSLDVATIADFYYKRIKRIWIIYYLIIFAINLSKQFLQAEIWWPNNNIYAFFSLLFLTNQKIISDQNDYFNAFKTDVTANNLFLHCWSLSVEVQFYTIVPFVFIGLHQLKSIRLRIIALIIASIISFSITFISIDPNFTFNFAIARFYQFFAGILGHIIGSELISDAKKDNYGWRQYDLCALAAILAIFWPLHVAPTILRIFVTILTAYILVANFELLCSPFSTLAYIGDISYLIYLIHWPIWLYFKNYLSVLSIIYLIGLLSILVHHSIETNFLRQNHRPTVFAILASLIAANSLLLYSLANGTDSGFLRYSKVHNDVIDENLKLTNVSWTHPPCDLEKFDNTTIDESFGHCKFPPGNGTLKIMLIGNSYTLNQAQTIHKAFRGNFSSFEYVSMISNYGIYADDIDGSRAKLEYSKRIAAREKPDVIFVISRFMQSPRWNIIDIENDKIVRKMRENVAYYETIAKKVYIMSPLPQTPLNFLNIFVSELMLKTENLEYLNIPKMDFIKDSKNLRRRLNNLKCSNCELYDMSRLFFNGKSYQTFDAETNLAYFDNEIHLTPPALQLIESFYNEFLTKMKI
ncbi:unnamed protein product [Caenorhabditis bovis]|uniref:Acyl_transf_3 domain-containing protein n=1 Tax=Caenorhabditis bovis TaxID=2654633 RepID=A0A8S1F2H0_9PELO|nr:unnamed protein product [Caenorhabditis bovis]